MFDISFASIVAVFLGGGLGSLLRFAISKTSAAFLGTKFPYGTLAANTLGACLAGYAAVVIFERKILAPHHSDLLLAGFLGGLTTFSSMVLDTHRLWLGGEYLTAALYVTLNLAIGFILFHLAFATARGL